MNGIENKIQGPGGPAFLPLRKRKRQQPRRGIQVNGNIQSAPSFCLPPGGRSNWENAGATIRLYSRDNTLELVALSGEGIANIDQIMLYAEGTGSGNCEVITSSSAPETTGSFDIYPNPLPRRFLSGLQKKTADILYAI